MLELTAIDVPFVVQIYSLLGAVLAIQTLHGLVLRAVMVYELPAPLALLRHAVLFVAWALECFWLPYYAMREILLGTFPRGANGSAWNWGVYCASVTPPEEAPLEKGSRVASPTPVLLRRESVVALELSGWPGSPPLLKQ